MKKTRLLLFIFVMLSSVVWAQETEKPWTITPLGSYRIERFWEQYAQTYVLVSYKNTTANTYRKAVYIQAILYDSNENMLLTNDRAFFGKDALIVPGFEGTLKFPYDIEGKAKSVRVKIISAN